MTKFKTIFISNSANDAVLCEDVEISYFMIDLEILGKEARQYGRNTLISRHTIDDIIKVRSCLKNTKLLVRVNPINECSEEEINSVIAAGADTVMLPMARTSNDVSQFCNFVDSRAETILLVETGAAFLDIENIVSSNKIDRVHLGLNDLHLELKLKFMFQVLASDSMNYFKEVLSDYGIPFGVGGIAPIGRGLLASDVIMSQHRLLGSDCAILSRDFKKALDECGSDIEKRTFFRSSLKDLFACYYSPIEDEVLCRKSFKQAVNNVVKKL